jgi:hypothetical protein
VVGVAEGVAELPDGEAGDAFALPEQFDALRDRLAAYVGWRIASQYEDDDDEEADLTPPTVEQ